MKKRKKILLTASMVLAACGSLCLGRSLTTLPEIPEKERPKIERREESEQKEPDLEEANQPTEPEEPVASAPEVPVPKTGDYMVVKKKEDVWKKRKQGNFRSQKDPEPNSIWKRCSAFLLYGRQRTRNGNRNMNRKAGICKRFRPSLGDNTKALRAETGAGICTTKAGRSGSSPPEGTGSSAA